jgi:hypothetical protein
MTTTGGQLEHMLRCLHGMALYDVDLSLIETLVAKLRACAVEARWWATHCHYGPHLALWREADRLENTAYYAVGEYEQYVNEATSATRRRAVTVLAMVAEREVATLEAYVEQHELGRRREARLYHLVRELEDRVSEATERYEMDIAS